MNSFFYFAISLVSALLIGVLTVSALYGSNKFDTIRENHCFSLYLDSVGK